MEPTTFLHRDVPAFKKRVHRLGLAANNGIDDAGIREGFERGINYVFWNPTANRLTAPLRDACAKNRESIVIATGPTLAYLPGFARRRVERVLKVLKTDYIDVLQLFWLGRMSFWTSGVVDELVKLRDEGKVRALGVSIHDRQRAGQLALESPLDMLMIRYNAAHPGAERDIFPHLSRRHPAVVAYTATSWRKLLRAPRGWNGKVPSAGDCYRFCLTNESVDVVLTGPDSTDQLRATMRDMERGPMNGDELSWMREFGRVVHG